MRDHSARRWHVRYDLAYDGGGATWTGYYRTRRGARFAMLWNQNVSSWGGTAELFDTFVRRGFSPYRRTKGAVDGTAQVR